MSEIDLSILIITYGREQLLKRCLDSIVEQVGLVEKSKIEILVGINGEDDSTKKFIQNYFQIKLLNQQDSSKRLTLKSIHISRRNLGAARNELIKMAEGKWIYFIDDDACIVPSFLNKILNYTLQEKYSIIGGPNLHILPANDVQKAQEYILSKKIWVGPFAHRYSSRFQVQENSNGNHLILCNLLVRNEKWILFNSCLSGAEENALLFEMLKRGHKAKYDPTFFVHHERRENLFLFFKQARQMGSGRGQYTWHYYGKYYFLLFGLLFIFLFLSPFVVLLLCFISSILDSNRPSFLRLFQVGLALYVGYSYGYLKTAKLFFTLRKT